MKHLITYAWKRIPDVDEWNYEMVIAGDPIEWLASVQDDEETTYILINVQPMTDRQAKKYDGEFKGM